MAIHDRVSVYSEMYRTGVYDEAKLKRLERFWRWRLDCLDGSAAGGTEEYQGLTAFLAISNSPDDLVFELGLTTLIGAEGHVQYETRVWERLTELASVEPRKAFPLVELVLRGAMNEEWPFLTKDMVEPALKATLDCADADVAASTKRLIHELGERGYEEYGQLLQP